MGLLSKIKADAQKSGSNKGKFIFFKEGEKKRIRFLQDMEEGIEVVFHDSFADNVNVPCQEIFGKSCSYCEQEGLRTRSQYAWCVWDYEAKEVKILMYPMNNCSPLGSIAAAYENYGTLLDRDFVISVTGKQQSKTFAVMPMDKNKFRNEKAKPFSKSKFLEILSKAYPDENSDDDEDMDDEQKAKKGSKSKGKKSKTDYSEMTAKELYNLCDDRGIEAEPKMKASYYIELLEEDDEENGSSGDWDEDDEDTVDYSELSKKELYNLCKNRGIEALPKKTEKYYINLLEEDDKTHEDWEDEDEEEEDWD